jgi:ubiquinone/menaquinone biosynthesis C-methylase UbiE
VNRLGALVYDRLVMKRSQQAGLADARRDALALATGEVLEIGAGTGLNIPAYPRAGITRLVLTEPHEPMRRQIAAKTADAPAPVEVVDATAEHLPFDDATFDTVTGTLVLCEADDPAVAVDEIARVLKPGGRYLFLEHVRSDDPALARRQDRWAPLWRAAAGGCNCNRDTLATIAASGLDVERRRIGRFPKSPRIVSPLLSGVAVRGDVL